LKAVWLMLAVFGMFPLALCVFEAKTDTTISVLPNHTGWREALGYYRVSGEVENIGDNAVKDIWITSTFYNSGGNLIGTVYDHAHLKVLLQEIDKKAYGFNRGMNCR